jgi:hypothetical protein
MESFVRNGCDVLRPVFDDLSGEIGWNDIRVLRLIYTNDKLKEAKNEENAVIE